MARRLAPWPRPDRRPPPPAAHVGRTWAYASFGPPGQVVEREALPDIDATRIAVRQRRAAELQAEPERPGPGRNPHPLRRRPGGAPIQGPAGRPARRHAAARGRARQERLRGHRAALRGPRLRVRVLGRARRLRDRRRHAALRPRRRAAADHRLPLRPRLPPGGRRPHPDRGAHPLRGHPHRARLRRGAGARQGDAAAARADAARRARSRRGQERRLRPRARAGPEERRARGDHRRRHRRAVRRRGGRQDAGRAAGAAAGATPAGPTRRTCATRHREPPPVRTTHDGIAREGHRARHLAAVRLDAGRWCASSARSISWPRSSRTRRSTTSANGSARPTRRR